MSKAQGCKQNVFYSGLKLQVAALPIFYNLLRKCWLAWPVGTSVQKEDDNDD